MGNNQMSTAQLLSSLLSGYGNAQAGQYDMLGGQMANMAAQQGQSLGNLYFNTAQGQANALTGGAAGNAQLGQSLLPGMASGIPYAGADAQGIQQFLMFLAGGAGRA
jgi:hypothetical protein